MNQNQHEALLRDAMATLRAPFDPGRAERVALEIDAALASAPDLLHWLEWALKRIDPQHRGEYYDRAQAVVDAAKG